ncbi:MAG: GntR family transcriptional regulator [Sphingomonas bacterium]|uniref:GntR family transcriptional regulator n=1 Tax=Sphingomonas bacterium TaxID=1895847 RepID=UPI002617656A|nr:GntR family transcriptional regulator [Sphingomonas bacterium]MDB5707200.1 GntR family transcriptional regulator [Sphingomonas bacterium]
MALQVVGEGRADQGKLSRKVTALILDHLAGDAYPEDGHLTETGLAAALNVSRTPVRAALEHLAELGIVASLGPRRGYRVAAAPDRIRALVQQPIASDEEEEFYLLVAQDFLDRRIPEQFTETDMLRQYAVSRSTLQRVLQRMASDRVIERNPGYGWRFAPLLRSVEAHDESYRFRMTIEPAALEQPGFALDPAWLARTRREHEATLATPPGKVSMVRFFAMNADFHETLALCSGNIFFHQAVQQQNQIRRFQNYSWTYGDDRIAACCHEHLEILAALEAGDQAWAATLMRRHLELASRLKPAPDETQRTISA